MNAAAPRRIKLTIRTTYLRASHCPQLRTMLQSSLPVLDAVDKAAHFTTASFLRNQSSDEIWQTMQRMWFQIYMRTPYFLKVDQGTCNDMT